MTRISLLLIVVIAVVGIAPRAASSLFERSSDQRKGFLKEVREAVESGGFEEGGERYERKRDRADERAERYRDIEDIEDARKVREESRDRYREEGRGRDEYRQRRNNERGTDRREQNRERYQ
ncbi:MAG: hypothetical protein AAGG02_00440 [Cyanobacteria bacterium P01_H01_bin.15]